MTNVLELRRVTKKFGKFTAVDELDFEVPKGSIYGLLGPNGAGKTTAIRMVLDIYKPTSGQITVLGEDSALKVRNRIGYLPEEKGLYKKMKAWAIVAYFATLKGMDRKSAKKRAYELLERYGLKDFANARTEALSKGMGQKVQVLASIAHDPELVILDEPFSGLDPVNQGVMEEVIRDMASRGASIIFSTHVMQHAERICHRILLVNKGKKAFDGTIKEARATIPRRIRIATEDDLGPIRALRGVNSVTAYSGEGVPPGSWEIQVQQDFDPQAVLETCFQNSIRLHNYDRTEPTLHDVFVHLVGDEAKEAKFR